MRNDIKFNIIDTCSIISTDNEAITILLKDSQDSTSISTIYIPPASTISTTLSNNIKNSTDNVILTRDLNGKHTDFNNTKTDKWSMALKKLYTVLISSWLITANQHTETAEQILAT